MVKDVTFCEGSMFNYQCDNKDNKPQGYELVKQTLKNRKPMKKNNATLRLFSINFNNMDNVLYRLMNRIKEKTTDKKPK